MVQEYLKNVVFKHYILLSITVRECVCHNKRRTSITGKFRITDNDLENDNDNFHKGFESNN